MPAIYKQTSGMRWLYLPWLNKSTLPPPRPDLMVESVSVVGQALQIVIGIGECPCSFALLGGVCCVDAKSIPRWGANQPWHTISLYGAAWAVMALRYHCCRRSFHLVSGDRVILWPEGSNLPEQLLVGSVLYVQADSVNFATTFGAVRESHEANGDRYNDIAGPVVLVQSVPVENSVQPARGEIHKTDPPLPHRTR